MHDLHADGGEIDDVPAARYRIRAFPVDVLGGEGRRHLCQRAGQRRDRVAERRGLGMGEQFGGRGCRFPGDLAGAVVGISFVAEANHRVVHLRLADDVRQQARRGVDGQYEQAGRERVERAGVPDPLGASGPSHDTDDIVRGHPRRLIDKQQS